MNLNLFTLLILRAHFHQLQSQGLEKIKQLIGWLSNAELWTKQLHFVASYKKRSIPESDEESLYSQRAGKQDGFVFVTSVQEPFDRIEDDKYVQTNHIRGYMLIWSAKVQNIHIYAIDYVQLWNKCYIQYFNVHSNSMVAYNCSCRERSSGSYAE